MDYFHTKQVSCKPISSLSDLLNWHPTAAHASRKFNVKKIDETYLRLSSRKDRKIIVCHDMKNNYLEDKYFQGFNKNDAFRFYHWNLIDMFIYFSHHFVTIPPESWINCAHENNCRMLGTFITEFTEGKKICDEFLSSKDRIDLIVNKLVELTEFYGFDGWLVNIENHIDHIENLKYFVKSLTERLRELNNLRYKVIWYDSVIQTGELKWQNELNDLNKEFFDLCDGFFVNYTWTKENLSNTKENAKERIGDVYVGVDVFGRGCLGGGGFNSKVAFEAITSYDLNTALFAPGWLHECNSSAKFIENNEKFWNLLDEYTRRQVILALPLISSFTHGCAPSFFINGKLISTINGWYNLNLQSFMPSVATSRYVEWCYDDAYYGGNSILIKNDLAKQQYVNKFKLFDTHFLCETGKIIQIEYVFKVDEINASNLLLNFDYCLIDDLNTIKNFKTEIFSSDEFDLIAVDTNSDGLMEWKKKRFHMEIKKNILIRAINVLCEAKSINQNDLIATKLGLIRIIEWNEVNILNELKLFKSQLKIECKKSLMVLNNFVHLLIDLKWSKLSSDTEDMFKYFNILINQNIKNNGNDEPSLLLAGSTRADRFQVCLKLKKNFKLEPCSEEQALSFDIYIQPVDKYLCIISPFSKACQIENDLASNKINVTILGVKSSFNDQEESKQIFIEDILFDLEYFN